MCVPAQVCRFDHHENDTNLLCQHVAVSEDIQNQNKLITDDKCNKKNTAHPVVDHKSPIYSTKIKNTPEEIPKQKYHFIKFCIRIHSFNLIQI